MPDTDHSDVLIIGAGLSGGVVAHTLTRSGFSVTCLERGQWHDRENYRGNRRDGELTALGPWSASPGTRQRVEDYPVIEDDADMKPLMFNGVGGSTILYGGHWMRMLPSDFRVRQMDHIADDWPISYGDLAPYYDRVDRAFGVSGLAGDPAYPHRPDYPMPPLPIGTWGEKIAGAHHRMGWHWWPGSNSIASRQYQGRRPCVQRSTCGTGCNEGAKASTDLTHWRAAVRDGANLLARATVSEIIVDDSGKIEGAAYRGDDGVNRKATADVVVMAASAIGTPRLLLHSTSRRHKSGLANSSGLVGKRLMMHPFTRVVGFFDEPMQSWQGHWGQSVYSMQFAETDRENGFLRGAKWNLSPSGGPLFAAMSAPPGARYGTRLHEHMRKWTGRSAIWGISCEDLPEEHNCVALDDRTHDEAGVPAARLSYRLSDNAKAMLAFNADQAIASFEEAGAHETLSYGILPEYGWHPLGTCRMGNDPETSVVDHWGRAHDASNLFIVDGSTFVTGSSVNPAATIAALALRTADRLIANRREIGR